MTVTSDIDMTLTSHILTIEHILIPKRYHNSWSITLYWFQTWYRNSCAWIM